MTNKKNVEHHNLTSVAEKRIGDIMVASYQAEKLGNTSFAIKGWNTLLKETISDELKATTYLNLAKMHQREGTYDVMMECIHSAISLNPTNSEAYFVLGYFELEQSHTKDALHYFLKAYELSSDDTGLLNNIANCYDHLEEFENALSYYTKIIALDKTYTPVYYNRGNVYTKLKEYKLAIKDLSTAITLDESFYQAYYNRGTIYKLIGEYELATKDLEHAKDLATTEMNNA